MYEPFIISALGDNITCKSLVERMICHDARVRPSTVAVLKHPMFWSRQKVWNLIEIKVVGFWLLAARSKLK